MIRSSNRTHRVAAGVLAVLLTLTGLTLLGSGSASASPSSMLGSVNASRANAGLPAYEWNSHLASVAAAQARRMANRTTLFHNANLASDVGNYRWVGENVGYGPSTNVVQNAFMKSPAHRSNILDGKYTQIGIAEVKDDKGRLWIAQVFRQPAGATSSAPKVTKKKTSTTKADAKKKSPAPKATRAPRPSKPEPAPAAPRSTRPSGAAGDAKAPATTRPTPRPTPSPKATSTPSPAPTLAERVQQAIAQSPPPSGDPLTDTFAFAATMNSISG